MTAFVWNNFELKNYHKGVNCQKKQSSVYPFEYGSSSSASILEVEQLVLFLKPLFEDSTSAQNML